MKQSQIIWTVVGVVVLFIAVGYFAGWFGKKTSTSTMTKSST